MRIHHAHFGLSIALALVSIALISAAASGQSASTQARTTDKGTADSRPDNRVAASEPKNTVTENKVVPEQRGEDKKDDLAAEIAAVKADNAAVREMLRRMEEQQKVLLDTVDRLQKRLDGSPSADAAASDASIATDAQPVAASQANVPPSPPPSRSTSAAKVDPVDKDADRIGQRVTQALTERYRDGIIIWETGPEAKVPFLMRFNNNTQIRFLNTQDSPETFTDHLGVVRPVNTRNDITVNRAMFILGGYIWDQRLKYSLTVWTSAGSNSIVVAGNIGWQFNKQLTVTGGYFGVPGSRSLVNSFPYFAATDRTMADNFFRPAFTQGVEFKGEIVKNWHYLALVGNGLNTLNISAAKIDENLVLAGSTWWEPLGAYAPPGKSVNMYDDYYSEKKVRIRLGTSFTRAREDRFSNLDTASPENVAIHNSDGVLTFATGAFAPGVTVQKALYKMWAIDWGLKYDGLAINGQYYNRWLSEFEADGPLPLDSTFDHGFEMSIGKFFVPKKLMGYVRGSMVFGHFNNSHEYAGGVKWHFLPTERLWFQAELMRVWKVPYGGTFTPYTAGLSGWVPMVQTVIGF